MDLIKTAHPHRYLQATPRNKTADTSIYTYIYIIYTSIYTPIYILCIKLSH